MHSVPHAGQSRTAISADRAPTLADHAAFAIWIAAYVAVLGIIFAPKGTFDTTSQTGSTPPIEISAGVAP